MLLSSSPVHKCLKKKLKKNHACLLKFILCDLGRLGGNNFHGPDFLIELLNFYVCLFIILVLVSLKWKRHQGSWIKFGKRNMWNLNWLFLELLQIPIKI